MHNKIYIVLILLSIINCKEKAIYRTDKETELDNKISKKMATYYVSPTGNNGNAGTQASPWATLNYACTRTINGDIIHMLAGTHNISSQCALPVGVSIEGASKTTTIIRSTKSGTTFNPASFTILLSSGSLNTNGNQHISNLTLQSTTPYQAWAAIGVENRGNVEILNCNISNFDWYGVYMVNGTDDEGSIPTPFATGNKVTNCTITNCGLYYLPYGTVYPDGDSKGSINIGGQDGMIISGNTVTVNRADGANGNCIDAVPGHLKNVKVYNNTLTKVFTPYVRLIWDFAMEWWDIYEGNEIYNNDIIGSIDLVRVKGKGTGTYSVWIHDNNIGQNAPILAPTWERTRGIDLEIYGGMSDIIIERNYIHDVNWGVQHNFEPEDIDVHDIRISYNIFNNITGAGSQQGWGIYYGSPGNRGTGNLIRNIEILNNVFIAGTNGAWGIHLPDAGTATNIEVNNNIITGFDYAVYGTGSPLNTTINILSIDRNIFYGNGSNAVTLAGGLSPTNYPAGTNYTSDPLFVSSSNFHLQAGSPGIDAGIDVGLLYDYENSPVGDPPSIGAYEYGANIAVTTVTVTGEGNATTITVDMGTLQMYAHIDPHDATNQTVVWSVTNGTGSASISATGLLTAITDGTVTVKATSNG